jgi:putative membrane protein
MGLGMGFGLFGVVLLFLLWAGLIAVAVWLVRALFPNAGQPPASSAKGGSSAREILDRRYARGEINREEYDLIVQTISEKHRWK